ncbi:MAG: alpha/beta hydrolase [Tannerellaceae bacterium]|nr:alpha/beta hydrolase [Tannerellaceae bacterium]
MKKICGLLLIFLSGSLSLQAQEVFRIYDGVVPGSENRTYQEGVLGIFGNHTIVNVTDPTVTVYLPEPEKATGAAMVVCPGGAFQMLAWDYEGEKVGQWLAEKGIAAFVLKYRLISIGENVEQVEQRLKELFMSGGSFEEFLMTTIDENESVLSLAYEDGRQAIAFVRQEADRWNIQPDKIGIMGFSAGAMLTMQVAIHHTEKSRPDLVAPIYGNWEGTVTVPEDAAPLFMCLPQFDNFFPDPMTNFVIYRAWQQAKVPAEIHFFYEAEHGFGMKKEGKAVDSWADLFYNFMKSIHFIDR